MEQLLKGALEKHWNHLYFLVNIPTVNYSARLRHRAYLERRKNSSP